MTADGLVGQIGRSSDQFNFITYKIGMTAFYLSNKYSVTVLHKIQKHFKMAPRGKPVAYGLHRPTA